MATLVELEARGELERLDAALDPDEQEFRCVYALRIVVDGLQKRLSTMVSKWKTEQTPAEQLDEILYNFVSGNALDYPKQFHEIKHHGDGFWELRSPDLRLFGFFYKIDCFICTDVVDKNFIGDGAATSGYIVQGKFRRNRLDLDEPKWITGSRPEDVVSNCYRSQ